MQSFARFFAAVVLMFAFCDGAAAQTTGATGGVDTRPEVTIQCEGVDRMEGVSLRVLAPCSAGGMLGKTPVKASFDANDRCSVRLPRGKYVFEVLEKRDKATFVCLKTNLLTIMRDQTVTLAAMPPAPVSLTVEDEGRIPMTEFAVRSDSITGEICWKAHEDGGTPKVIASEDAKYRARLLGLDDQLHAAVWKQVLHDGWEVTLAQRETLEGDFHLYETGPKIERAGATFAFPDSRIELDVTNESRIVTNRRFLSYAYWFTTPEGRSVRVHPQLGSVPKKRTYYIGGQYKPVAWAHVMKAKKIDETTTHFIWGADLVDQHGYLVDIEKSHIEWKTRGRTPTGEIEQNTEIDEATAKRLTDPSRFLRVDVSFALGEEPIGGTLTPVGFRPYAIPGFKTSAPPHWQLQAANYLARAVRVYGCIEEVEEKFGKHTTEIRWHKASGIAWGTVGGKNAWIMMPFKQLADSFDHYASPWALPHEMLHNFKYNHGDAMNAANEATIHKMNLFRWYMSDHPEATPGDAFPVFRKYQRGCPHDVE